MTVARYAVRIEPMADKCGQFIECLVMRAGTALEAYQKARAFFDDMCPAKPRFVAIKRTEITRRWRSQPIRTARGTLRTIPETSL